MIHDFTDFAATAGLVPLLQFDRDSPCTVTPAVLMKDVFDPRLQLLILPLLKVQK